MVVNHPYRVLALYEYDWEEKPHRSDRCIGNAPLSDKGESTGESSSAGNDSNTTNVILVNETIVDGVNATKCNGGNETNVVNDTNVNETNSDSVIENNSNGGKDTNGESVIENNSNGGKDTNGDGGKNTNVIANNVNSTKETNSDNHCPLNDPVSKLCKDVSPLHGHASFLQRLVNAKNYCDFNNKPVIVKWRTFETRVSPTHPPFSRETLMEKLLQALICIDDRTPEETEVNIKKNKKNTFLKTYFLLI